MLAPLLASRVTVEAPGTPLLPARYCQLSPSFRPLSVPGSRGAGGHKLTAAPLQTRRDVAVVEVAVAGHGIDAHFEWVGVGAVGAVAAGATGGGGGGGGGSVGPTQRGGEDDSEGGEEGEEGSHRDDGLSGDPGNLVK